uniref:Uncharacterized protein n=1 Tax=Fagus sylvatica TaxID=28930 RepID=A0A2N9ERZ1_FAGSY
MKPGGKELRQSSEERNGPRRRWSSPTSAPPSPHQRMFQVDEGDVDELALLFAEDLSVNATTTEGDSTALPIRPDQYEEVDLEGILDEEDLKGYRIEEETFDGDNGEEADLPDLLPHLMISRGLETLEFEMFCEHEDPESHLQRYRKKMALLRNIACWEDLARAFLDRYRHNLKTPPPSNITTTTAEEEYAGPMVEGLSIHTITEEEDSTTPPTRHCQQGEEAKMWTCVPLLQRVSSSNEVKSREKSRLGTRCTAEQKEALIALLREFHEIFAWSYQDMPGLDTDIVVHKIPLKPECKPVKQALRRMKPEVILKIKEEVEKQLKAGFLSTVTYSDWVANIVPVPKKDGKVRMCVDYRDLNRASPKDNFPLPHIDTLVDNTATNVVFSFMDGFSGYNQIKMAEEDKSKTAFVTHWGTFVYDVMPFGLKNAGATYQRAMVTLFHDMIHHEIEVYVDDMIAKSRTAQDHLTDLRKLVPTTEEVSAQIEPEQVCLRRHIRKTAREAFDKIKEYLLNPPILVPPTPGRPLILYLTVQEASMGCMLGQQDETGKKEQAIYYLSKKFTEPETRYLLVEKTCCALAWASKKLRQYMLYYTTWLVSRMDPIKYIFEKPALTGKIARWQVLLSEFDILFVARKAIKGQAIADYLADYPSEQLELNGLRVPRRRRNDSRRRQSRVDGSFTLTEQRNAVGSGIGAVLVSPKGQQTPIAVKLGFDCTNNMTEYEACIVGLQAALEFGAYELEVFGDSLLIVSQTNGEWQARDPKLIPYQRYISRLVPKFKYVTFTYTPRAHNHFADALATLASLIKLVEGDDVRPLRIETRDIPAYCVCIEECMNVEAEIDDKPWYYDIKRFIQDREYPSRATENEKKYIRRMAFQFFLSGEILHVQTCHKCQMYQNSKNAPPQYLHTMASPWPFSAWGMDVIGAITPKASNGHEFILVGHRLFYQVGGGMFLQECHSSRGHPLCQQFKIQHHNSAPYRPKMNGAVEAANKNVKKILSKMTETYKDWHEHLPYAFVWKKPNGPKHRYEQLNFIDEKRLAALCHGQLYQRRIERAYNKKARPRTFQPGDLVLKKRNMALSDPRGKFAPSYEGPYVVKKAFSGGAIILADMDGEEFRSPINSDSVIKPGKQRKSVRTLPSDGNYHGYGENLGRGAIGKSNVESWTWRLSAESPQGSGKGRIPLIMLLPDGASSGTQRIHHLVNLVKRSDHRETLLIEPRSIGLKSIMHQSPTQDCKNSRSVPSPTRVHLAQKPSKRGPGYISQSLESFDQIRPRLTKFDQGLTWTVDQTEKLNRTDRSLDHSEERNESFDSILYGPKTDEKRGSYGPKLRKNGPTLSQILLSVVDKTAYLGGNVCAKILSDPLQLGPRAKTLRQEVHFSYHTQLSDRQELLRSSRNLSQKMTPWHKEHSDGLRSQDHILRTQARLCARPVPLENSGISHRRCHACAQSLPDSQQVDPRARARWKEDTFMHDVELSDRQDFIGSSRNPDRKTALKRTKNTPVASVRGTISHKSKLGFPQIRNLAKVGSASFPTVPRTSKSDIGS